MCLFYVIESSHITIIENSIMQNTQFYIRKFVEKFRENLLTYNSTSTIISITTKELYD